MNTQNPLRILVIEDDPSFLAQAQEMLTGHTLWLASDFGSASVILADQKLDVVLTDLNFPLRSRYADEVDDRSGERQPRPYGAVIALKAANMGIKKVGILTLLDLNHSLEVSHFAADTDLRVGESRILGRGDRPEWVPGKVDTKRWDLLLVDLLQS